MRYDLLIQHGTKLMQPVTVDGVTVDWQRSGQPGKMTFSVIKTPELSFSEGDAVKFSVDGKPFFQGFVFEKDRIGLESKKLKVTAYDQIYYLTKNKDTYNYQNKTAADVIRMIAEDFHLRVGVLAPTPYLIRQRLEDNRTLYDMITTALKLTLTSTGVLYVLYDNAGLLTLTPIEAMKLPLICSADTIGDFSYKTTISQDTYNRVKLVQENKDAGTRKIFLAQDVGKQAQWGVLQYYEKLNDDANDGMMRATQILTMKNRKTRTLSLKNVLGDTRVRAGSSVVCMLGLGDMNLSNYMMVEQVTHEFRDNEHLMSLDLKGGNGFE
ncbi:MAG: hydrolase [Clostridia bacterium]|nr:hydrolase [Clostridia bacterium]